ncbi:MAG: TRAP transporter substrate-binding protein [Proteobacteria bacterium]|nr:TRAP transporter substrate-binding protein [Pseudomonadota bacterium]MBU1581758.1 TRAP transporter substrate-binding protein [Pseudomonadota bacterium]MBU2454809.1 TRAP transporter substrate-binding protein [Pseudomonadota bacterium]MBU2630248.1 TRAP transporter substrate-binding protein [Pseudomonadota bacterium]
MVTFVFVLSLNPALAAEKKVLLKVPVCFSTALPGLGSTIPWVAERIETASNGTLKMNVYEPGKLVAPFEILGAVSAGKINAGYATAGYWAGKIPASPIFSAIPFGPEAGEMLAWLYYGNGMNLYQEMYDSHGYNVKVLVCGVIAPETSGWFTKEIQSADDIKGLRIRFFGLGGQVMQKLGASVSLLPGGEIFPALEKKAIDATEFSMPAIDERLGFYKIAKYNYFPGWHQQATAFELLINKDVWNGMSDHQRMVIEMLCKAATLDAFAYTEAIQAKAMKENVEHRGVKNMYWSPEMLATYKSAWEEVAKEQAEKDVFFKKVWDDVSAFRAEYKTWQTYGFLPRPAPPK